MNEPDNPWTLAGHGVFTIRPDMLDYLSAVFEIILKAGDPTRHERNFIKHLNRKLADHPFKFAITTKHASWLERVMQRQSPIVDFHLDLLFPEEMKRHQLTSVSTESRPKHQ